MSLDILVIVAGKSTTRLGSELVNREECLYDTGPERNRKKNMSLLTTVIKISDREMYKGRKLPYMYQVFLGAPEREQSRQAFSAATLLSEMNFIKHHIHELFQSWYTRPTLAN